MSFLFQKIQKVRGGYPNLLNFLQKNKKYKNEFLFFLKYYSKLGVTTPNLINNFAQKTPKIPHFAPFPVK